MRHHTHSIQELLRNDAKKSMTEYQMILIRYFQERILFRLSISPYKDMFCLKGGALLYALEKEKSRHTLDLDLLAFGMQPDPVAFQQVFTEICSIQFEADGVTFDLKSLNISQIKENDKYAGLRIAILTFLGNIRQRMQIDIGFGDVITPGPVLMNYPTLLSMPAPHLKTYSIETVIAEKFEAMISLAEVNSRMKDFYDVYRLLESKGFDQELLSDAISNTFKNRGAILRENHPLFDPDFSSSESRNQLWKAFLKRSKLEQGLEFKEVHQKIAGNLLPIYKTLF